ncbi:MAG: phage/plasmid primase, P4 family [Actinomyces sp.]|nr:phage/plasmid primase, P4 family [Actinomyces sp.]
MNSTPDKKNQTPYNNPTLTVQSAALLYTFNGYSVIPLKADADGKKPAIAWKPYTQQRAGREQVDKWFSQPHNLAVVCGKVSDNLLMIETEGRAKDAEKRLDEAASARGIVSLWEQVKSGWVESTPSGGVHYFIKCEQPPIGNVQLARDKTGQILAETRGEGGYCVIAPSKNQQGAWTRKTSGRISGEIPRLTAVQTQQILDLFKTLNEYEQPKHAPETARALDELTSHEQQGALRPGDDYNQRVNWHDILTPLGWKLYQGTPERGLWTRPGKDSKEGASASTQKVETLTGTSKLKVFTTNALPFEAEKTYSKFEAYTLINYGQVNPDTESQAASALARAGYGTMQPALHEPIHEGEKITADTFKQIRNRNETALAAWLGQTVQGEHMYVEQVDCWHVWNGGVWKAQKDAAAITRRAAALLSELPAREKTGVTFRNRMLAANKLKSIIGLTSTQENLRHKADELNADPELFCHAGGMTNLRTGKTREALPGDLFTRQSPYEPKQIPTPLFDDLLAHSMGGDLELIEYLQKALGSSLTGYQSDVFYFFHGEGSNGKSVLIKVVETVLGIGQWAASLSSEYFDARANSHESTETLVLASRLVTASETNAGAAWDEAKLKALTGGDTRISRAMYSNPINYEPQATIIIAGNQRPQVEAGGFSFWRRARVIPFDYIVPESKKDKDLPEKIIKEEASGVLWWLMQGAQKWLEDGKKDRPPLAVVQATAQYEGAEDIYGDILTTAFYFTGDKKHRLKRSQFTRLFTERAREMGMRRVGQKEIRRAIERAEKLGAWESKQSEWYICGLVTNGGLQWRQLKQGQES